MSKKVLEVLEAEFGAAIIETHSQFGDDTAVVDPAKWRAVARFLREDPRCAMDMFIDITAVDYLDAGLLPGDPPLRFEVVCHLRSVDRGHRIRIKARVGDEDAAGAEIDSLVPVWKGADWFERETFDMFGIEFLGHPDLRRLLMYPEFVGHPLRKDYPANKIQPLVEFRDVPGKLPPFGPDEGMSFGRQTHNRRMFDADEQVAQGDLVVRGEDAAVVSPVVTGSGRSAARPAPVTTGAAGRSAPSAPDPLGRTKRKPKPSSPTEPTEH